MPQQLCIACASSPPSKADAPFRTRCCAKPICAACLARNPRLRDYDPCLACLGGVRAAAARGALQPMTHLTVHASVHNLERDAGCSGSPWSAAFGRLRTSSWPRSAARCSRDPSRAY